MNYIYVNTKDYRASFKQVSGNIQLGELTVNAQTRIQLKKKSKVALLDMLEIIAEINQKIEEEKEEKKNEKETDKNKSKQ